MLSDVSRPEQSLQSPDKVQLLWSVQQAQPSPAQPCPPVFQERFPVVSQPESCQASDCGLQTGQPAIHLRQISGQVDR